MSPSIPAGSSRPAEERARRSNFQAVSIGHLAIDVFNSMGPVLLAQLRLTMGLSTAQVGLAVGLYQLLAGATQPVFGWLVDRRGSRRLGPLSVAWVIGLVALSAVFAPRIGYLPFLVLFGLAAVGSGAFHPQGTMHAGVAVSGRAATTTAIFFFCGQIGLSLGPFLAGFMIDRVGMVGITWLAALALPVPVWMALRMSGPSGKAAEPAIAIVAAGTETMAAPTDVDELAQGPSTSGWVVTLLAVIFGLRAWIFIGTAGFLPLLFQAAGASPTRQGVLTGAFWLGGGISGIAAGWFADRMSKRMVAALSTFAGGLLLLVLPSASGPWLLLVVLVCGGFLGAPHSVLMVLAQDLLPVRRGLASGYALGFLFSMGAVASWGIGLLAGHWPLSTVIQCGFLPGLITAGLLLLLPSTRRASTGGLES